MLPLCLLRREHSQNADVTNHAESSLHMSQTLRNKHTAVLHQDAYKDCSCIIQCIFTEGMKRLNGQTPSVQKTKPH